MLLGSVQHHTGEDCWLTPENALPLGSIPAACGGLQPYSVSGTPTTQRRVNVLAGEDVRGPSPPAVATASAPLPSLAIPPRCGPESAPHPPCSESVPGGSL